MGALGSGGPGVARRYLTMLRKATAENVVVEVSNLYDTFFVQIKESRVAPSVARLPYFDGDYWPGAIEEELQKIQKERDDAGAQKKGKKAKAPAAAPVALPTTKRGSGFRGQAAAADEAELTPGSAAAIGKQLMTKVSGRRQGLCCLCTAQGLVLRALGQLVPFHGPGL